MSVPAKFDGIFTVEARLVVCTMATIAPRLESFRCYTWCREDFMRATVSLDDELLRTAEEYSGLTERAALIREALKSLIAREAGRRLLALAGTAPNIEDVRRLRVDEL